MSTKRNEYLELDGLYYESDTHEWFHDKISTQYARKKNMTTSGEQDDALDIVCFVIRSKETGEYDRVAMDIPTNQIIFETKILEDLCGFIDRQKITKRFK